MRLPPLRNSLFSSLCLLVAGGLLAGCTTASGGTAGPSRGLLSPRPASTLRYIAALQGGIVARAGLALSPSDRTRALEAEYRALETAAAGQPLPWKGDEAQGEVLVNAPYQVGTQNCRQYRHSVTVAGREASARGAACRNGDGTWTPLT